MTRTHRPRGPPTEAKRTPAKHPTGAPGGRCLPALSVGLTEEKPAPSARLGDSFYFAVSKIVESLLRRGARWFERTGLKPAGLPLRRAGAPTGRFTGHSGEKTVSVRAPGEIHPFQLIVETGYFPLKAGRAPFGCSTDLPGATCIVRALAEILFKRELTRLNDFLLQQSRAGEL